MIDSCREEEIKKTLSCPQDEVMPGNSMPGTTLPLSRLAFPAVGLDGSQVPRGGRCWKHRGISRQPPHSSTTQQHHQPLSSTSGVCVSVTSVPNRRVWSGVPGAGVALL
ncbi:hypothetical protein E2C01_081657 [Portunus trituberculatus]|uniref:Uncharacterized protein n=1 Tax=Portunus trituberculatus TaxID=210409 RepID=A0A5B7IN04_PORTR|nr:hypothetical protein [Portunus trituberculatus]